MVSPDPPEPRENLLWPASWTGKARRTRNVGLGIRFWGLYAGTVQRWCLDRQPAWSLPNVRCALWHSTPGQVFAPCSG